MGYGNSVLIRFLLSPVLLPFIPFPVLMYVAVSLYTWWASPALSDRMKLLSISCSLSLKSLVSSLATPSLPYTMAEVI